MSVVRPQFGQALVDSAGHVSRQWADFLAGVWQAIGVVRQTKVHDATIDFPSIAAGGTATVSVTVPGARANDVVMLGLPSVDAGLVFDAHVSANDTVTVRASNLSSAAIDPASATFRLLVMMA